MSNLHALASAATAIILPSVRLTIYVSTGYTTSPDGTQVPTYQKIANISGDVQPLLPSDLQHMDGMNITSETRKIYLTGRYYGVNRVEVKGGDLIELPTSSEWPYGSLWQVVQVLEQYQMWCSLGVVRQLPETTPA